MQDAFVATFLSLVIAVCGGVIGWYEGRDKSEEDFIRDCSMTRVHIIDDNTLISCTVLKVNRTETPVQDNKKPEISL